MKIIHEKTGLVLGEQVVCADSFRKRLTGYMFYKQPPEHFDGLFFKNCKLVHNSFVRISLDVIFIDHRHAVVKVIRGFRPWKFSRIYFRAAHAIEFPTGTVPFSVSDGDLLVLEG